MDVCHGSGVDDVLLQPGYSEVLPREVDLSTRLTAEITLNIPILSAAMDTVTEARLAIALAQEGGIGVIHKNMTIEEQARQVHTVKKYESGIVRNPITVTPDMSIREVIDLTRAMGISGVPVVDGEQTVGIVTHRDLRFETRLEAPVSKVMTPRAKLSSWPICSWMPAWIPPRPNRFRQSNSPVTGFRPKASPDFWPATRTVPFSVSTSMVLAPKS